MNTKVKNMFTNSNNSIPGPEFSNSHDLLVTEDVANYFTSKGIKPVPDYYDPRWSQSWYLVRNFVCRGLVKQEKINKEQQFIVAISQDPENLCTSSNQTMPVRGTNCVSLESFILYAYKGMFKSWDDFAVQAEKLDEEQSQIFEALRAKGLNFNTSKPVDYTDEDPSSTLMF